jgi:predicted TPR repeat methyltransferase
MPQDRVQIGLEHHRAGRLMQAEANYRWALADDPNDAEAHHWLGVLLFQAGQIDEAAALLEQAAAQRPEDAAILHNFGLALLASRRVDDAIAVLQRTAAIEPDRAEIAVTLAQALLQRGGENDPAAAADVLRRVAQSDSASPQLHHNLGVALLRAGSYDEAIVTLTAATKAKADYTSAFFHLAVANRGKGDSKAARTALNKALEINPGHAAAWHALATLDAEAGNLDIAAALYRRAIKADARHAAAYRGLADVLARQGRPTESVAAFARAQTAVMDQAAAKALPRRAMSVAELEKRITPDDFGAQLHQALAGLMNLPPPSQIATDEVASLFDRYADRFDVHLKEKLQYRAPEAIAEAIRPHVPDRALDAMDLGCGTGLCGPLLRPHARILRGVDLSPAMIEKARERNVYDQLEVGDMVEAIRRLPEPIDLFVAADVLIYVGDLAPTFEAVAARLHPGGLFAYSVEAGDSDRFRLVHRTRRYTHAKSYLQRLGAIYGFEERVFQSVTLRTDAMQPVQGYLVVLRQPG